MKFQGKVAIVTGSGVGIGLAAALAFGRDGASLAIVDRDPEQSQAALRAVEAIGNPVIYCQTDVSQPDEVSAMVERVAGEWGRLDILVNNAGIYVQADAVATSEQDWDRVLGVNLTGAFLCTKYAVPKMIQGGGGVIVNVASEAGLVGIKNQVAYNVSKGGLIALTRSCAVDFAGRGVRVNCVCPGTTDTPLVRAAVGRAEDPAAARRHLEEIRPMNRLGKPEEIASAILYLASDESGYATGAVLSIDGGYTTQ
jgi:NAD(P)-dependent dehydrogenase (short-subunit alcohol dehydrogenase family)